MTTVQSTAQVVSKSVVNLKWVIWKEIGAGMAAEALSKIGLYFDELNKIRVLDPEVAQQTAELKDECKEFVDRIAEFQRIVDGFIHIIDSLSQDVEKEKMKAIGSRNLLKSVTKQREAQEQQLQSLVLEKRLQLERLRIQYDALKLEEVEQSEIIEQFTSTK